MKHFTMEELTRSQTARTKGIDNTPSAEHRSNIEMTVAQLLDPLRGAIPAFSSCSISCV